MIGVTILGATGSIGINTLDVLSRHPDDFRVVALTANRDVDRLLSQCLAFTPEFAVMADPAAADELETRLRDAGSDVAVLSGPDGLEHVAGLPQVGYVMAAIVGAAGLLPTLAAARAGKRILLANKEALVMSGQVFMREVVDHGAELLPIDSEHNAIFQCLPADFRPGVRPPSARRIVLTASGGPFLDTPPAELGRVTPEQACDHPNWNMGRKISVDSASMMNKGLEVIEACWLFDLPPEAIQVVIHRQSVIHSLVEYVDGSVLAQLGNPDMRTPIAHALAWPDRMASGVESLNLLDVARLEFEQPDLIRFPCLRLAYEAIERGGTAPAILNAANEVAVQAFLERKIGFTVIPALLESVLEHADIHEASTLEAVLRDDEQARALAMEYVGSGHREASL